MKPSVACFAAIALLILTTPTGQAWDEEVAKVVTLIREDEGAWNHGPQTRTEVLGVGPQSIGIYTMTRTTRSDSGETHASFCRPAVVSVPAVTTPGGTTPDVRVLGETVVPSQTIAPQTAYPGSSTTLVSLRYACLMGATDYGVYWNSFYFGTDSLAWLA